MKRLKTWRGMKVPYLDDKRLRSMKGSRLVFEAREREDTIYPGKPEVWWWAKATLPELPNDPRIWGCSTSWGRTFAKTPEQALNNARQALLRALRREKLEARERAKQMSQYVTLVNLLKGGGPDV